MYQHSAYGFVAPFPAGSDVVYPVKKRVYHAESYATTGGVRPMPGTVQACAIVHPPPYPMESRLNVAKRGVAAMTVELPKDLPDADENHTEWWSTAPYNPGKGVDDRFKEVSSNRNLSPQGTFQYQRIHPSFHSYQ